MRDVLPAPRDRLPIGELRASPLCLGAVRDPRVVAAAVDAGINFFFVSADMHWPLYEPVRRGLADLIAARPGVRDDLVVAAVSYVTQPEFTWMPFIELLRAVPGLGRVDVVVAGGAYGPELPTRLPPYRRHLTDHQIGARAVGASFHDRPACADHLARRTVDVGFARYNASHLGAREDLFPKLPAERPPLYNFKSTAGYASAAALARAGVGDEYWQPSITDHYRFALSAPAVDGLLLAPDDERQLAEIVEALAEGPLDEEEQEHLVLLAGLRDGTHELARS